MRINIIIVTIMIALGLLFNAFISPADAGSGRTDKYGCHYHEGTYVCH